MKSQHWEKTGIIEVAVVAMWRQAADGAVDLLLTRRPQGVHMGGLWELPGGKVEGEEPAANAACRELWEELGLLILPAALEQLPMHRHAYPDRVVLLHPFLTRWPEVPLRKGLGVTGVHWASTLELDRFPMPPANRPIINTLLARLASARK